MPATQKQFLSSSPRGIPSPTNGRGLRAPFPRGAHSPRKPLVCNARAENRGNCQIIGSFHHLVDNSLPNPAQSSRPNPAHLMISSRNAEPKDQVKLMQAPEMLPPSLTPPLPDDENHPISGRSPPPLDKAMETAAQRLVLQTALAGIIVGASYAREGTHDYSTGNPFRR